MSGRQSGKFADDSSHNRLQSMFGLSDDSRRKRLRGYSRQVGGRHLYARPLDAMRPCPDG